MQIGESKISDPGGVIRGVSGANFREIDISMESQKPNLHKTSCRNRIREIEF